MVIEVSFVLALRAPRVRRARARLARRVFAVRRRWARSASAASACSSARRARRIETVTGLMNLVMMPMFVLSGMFFSADRFPEVLQPLIRVLPLTALNDALRAVILEGAPLAALSAPARRPRRLDGGQLRRRPEALPLGLGKAARRARRRAQRGDARGGFQGRSRTPTAVVCECPPWLKKT